ncbi:inner membrane-spanning protein YciB [Paracoccus sp. (in: a-proteobacteria)]|uniref:inner membrane-spanning protein YciB n=1 Tax=Paracoccus sp. TaxID=267 RepID=UPI00272D210C|nr:inner membrane-spanning protein YciB [Paracoccus sp. (in: a-proteobacteria)]
MKQDKVQPASPRPVVKPWVKTVLEFGPLILFFTVFMLYRDQNVVLLGREYGGFVLATLAFVPVMIVALLILWRLTGRLAPMQVATLILVTVFGGLTLWLNDPRFLKIKPTIVFSLFAGILATGLFLRRNWLGAVLSEALPMTPEGWRILTIRMALFFAAMAIGNEIVWRTMSETTWVWFETFGQPILIFVFLMGNAGLFKAHALPEAEAEAAAPADSER